MAFCIMERKEIRHNFKTRWETSGWEEGKTVMIFNL